MDSLIIVSNLATLTTGVVLIGISSFLPTYIQGVMGKSPIIAGFALSFMSIGWVIGATVAGKVMFKYGFRRIAIVGGIWITKQRGVATASNMFMNILGSAMGAAVLGGILNLRLTSYLKGVSRQELNVIGGIEFDFDYVFSSKGKGLGLSAEVPTYITSEETRSSDK